jgi:ubiquinone biosynthesis protein
VTREFDMPTQPHLLLLQKTMVMVEGVASTLDPEINMWEAAGPFVESWLRDELGPEARLADAILQGVRTLADFPDLVRRIENSYPKPGAAPPAPPLPDIPTGLPPAWRYLLAAVTGAAAVYLGQFVTSF